MVYLDQALYQTYNLHVIDFINMAVHSKIISQADSMFHLNMCLVVVVWTCELCLLPHSLRKQHDLQNYPVEIRVGNKNPPLSPIRDIF